MIRQIASVPSTPIAAQRGERPEAAATRPAASGTFGPPRRPIMNSAVSSGTAISRQATTNTSTNSPPPCWPARNGNRHSVPRPTAAPATDR